MTTNPIQGVARLQSQVIAPVQGRFSTCVPRLAKKIAFVAVPALLLYAASNVPVAEAGPVAYAICVAACGPLAWACVAACLPVLAAPTP